ncbi:hypothetical protein ACFSTA_01650 [Ornithinibacillus salinisoli]|uniref:Uncharacterized protein n=1 Tax=Ornithinibacillus salinisoli TaxID=1848459 RepID=A0ABW4VW92_9BACI
MNQIPFFRRQRAYLSQFTTGQLHLKSPWVVAFFSFSYPGFGHMILHRYAAAFILILWETFINQMANINEGILYTLLGDFEKAKHILEERWLILYVGIYMFSIWDSYRTTIDLNKQYVLADREDAQILNMKMGTWDMNFLDKRKPWVALMWSVVIPGLGHLYLHKVITGFFMFGYTVVILYLGHIPEAIHHTMTGNFDKAIQALDMQWTLYIPSIYLFILYNAYSSAVELNKLFEKEMSKYLRQNYQNKNFKLPI